MTEAEPSYIDYETFLDPAFSAHAFANSLVLTTNNPSDTPIDLSTPLSRVLFDLQEIDTHIHTQTTRAALPLLTHTKAQDEASQTILKDVEAQVARLTDGYERLEKEVIQRHARADEVRETAERVWQTVRIGRAVARCMLFGRQLEAQMMEVDNPSGSTTTKATNRKEDHVAMVRAATTILNIRQIFAATGPKEEGEHLAHIVLVKDLRKHLVTPSEGILQTRSQQIVREFSMSSLVATTPSGLSTYAQTEETKARTISALLTLNLLSPEMQLAALQSYLRTALTSSLASIARALANLPNLDRTLLEVSARCQNIAALESLLESTRPLVRGVGTSETVRYHSSKDEDHDAHMTTNFLAPLLSSLDTASLPSYFWRSLAEGLAGRVRDLVGRGGIHARALRAQRERVRESLRECVLRGSQGPAAGGNADVQRAGGVWEREAAVMVGSVIGPLGK